MGLHVRKKIKIMTSSKFLPYSKQNKIKIYIYSIFKGLVLLYIRYYNHVYIKEQRRLVQTQAKLQSGAGIYQSLPYND